MSIVSSDPRPGIRQLTIDRPGNKNALDIDSYRQLTAALQAADADAGVHAIVVTGAQGVFTSGNDLDDFRRHSDPTPARDLLRALVLIETPLIAAVEGPAVGIGVTMLLHCDRDELLAVIDHEIDVFMERLASDETRAILNSMGS